MILYFQQLYSYKRKCSEYARMIEQCSSSEKILPKWWFFKKIKNQKNSRSIVDVYVGYSVVRRFILYVRYRIQALEHRWKRTWHSILWNKNRSLQDTWVSELSDTYDAYVLECSSARTLETMNLSELRVQSSLKRASFWIPRHDKYCDHVRVASDHDIFDQRTWKHSVHEVRIDLDKEDRFRR